MKKVITKRLRVTKNGKVLRRSMGLAHFKSRKRATQIRRRRNMRDLGVSQSILKQYAN